MQFRDVQRFPRDQFCIQKKLSKIGSKINYHPTQRISKEKFLK